MQPFLFPPSLPIRCFSPCLSTQILHVDRSDGVPIQPGSLCLSHTLFLRYVYLHPMHLSATPDLGLWEGFTPLGLEETEGSLTLKSNGPVITAHSAWARGLLS